jgi:holo-[acyl-carrier protein] synthase
VVDGIGIDVVEISRMQKAIDQWGDAFLDKIFTPNEISYARSKAHPAQHLAGRFAVKEAVAKALASGWSGGFRWKDVEVENDPAGKPSVVVHGHIRRMLGERRLLASISHSGNVAVACAIIEL